MHISQCESLYVVTCVSERDNECIRAVSASLSMVVSIGVSVIVPIVNNDINSCSKRALARPQSSSVH